jgi:DNA-binding NtrC family response regulator
LVVLIEDNEALSDNLIEALRAHGLTAVAAKSILETQRLEEMRPFAAIVDLRVPGGSDGEAMIRLQALYPGLPMFVITGHDIAPPLPYVEMFRKPFDTEGLLWAIEKVYESRTA